MDSPPVPASLPSRALRRSGSGLRTPRPHVHALLNLIALAIASVLGPLILFVFGLGDRFTILIRKLKTKQQPTMNAFGPTLHPARKRADPGSSPAARIPGEPVVSSRSFQRLKHRIIAFIGPQRARLIHQRLLTCAALLFLGCLSWGTWAFINSGFTPSKNAPAIHPRMSLMEETQMLLKKGKVRQAIELLEMQEAMEAQQPEHDSGRAVY